MLDAPERGVHALYGMDGGSVHSTATYFVLEVACSVPDLPFCGSGSVRRETAALRHLPHKP